MQYSPRHDKSCSELQPLTSEAADTDAQSCVDLGAVGVTHARELATSMHFTGSWQDTRSFAPLALRRPVKLHSISSHPHTKQQLPAKEVTVSRNGEVSDEVSVGNPQYCSTVLPSACVSAHGEADGEIHDDTPTETTQSPLLAHSAGDTIVPPKDSEDVEIDAEQENLNSEIEMQTISANVGDSEVDTDIPHGRGPI